MNEKYTIDVCLVNLATGDKGLVINRRLIQTADPNFEPPCQVVHAARNLAAVLGVELKVANVCPPDKEDWTWDDVLSQLPLAP